MIWGEIFISLIYTSKRDIFHGLSQMNTVSSKCICKVNDWLKGKKKGSLNWLVSTYFVENTVPGYKEEGNMGLCPQASYGLVVECKMTEVPSMGDCTE